MKPITPLGWAVLICFAVTLLMLAGLCVAIWWPLL